MLAEYILLLEVRKSSHYFTLKPSLDIFPLYSSEFVVVLHFVVVDHIV